MAKAESPLVGFNNNVRHKGRVFHVQTEDSGVKRPHIVTHLFADGGRIIKSTRTDYSEHLGRVDMHSVIRKMMKEQHKAMFIALRDGQLNETIDRMLGPANEVGESPASPSRPPSKRRSKPPPTLPKVQGAPAKSVPPEVEKPTVSGNPPLAKRAAPTLTDLVLADLETARARAGAVAAGARPGTKGGTPILGTPAVAPRPSATAGSGRYGAARPAAIFSTPPDSGSIFGGTSISEQSLDEVILSYLAEDLDPEDGD